MDVMQDIENLIHPIKEAVGKALAAAEADFNSEKTAIAAEIRAAASGAVQAAIAAAPALEADAVAAIKAVADAVEAALAARGL